MATSPMAEKRMIRICSVFTLMWVLVFLLGSETPIAFKRTREPLFLVQHGVCCRVVIHLHLHIHLHVDAPLLNIGQ